MPMAGGRMKRRTVLAATGAAVVAPAAPLAPAAPATGAGLTLRYDEPGTDWESGSMPIGNGILGASVLGGTDSDDIVLNEKTLWTGGPGSPGYDFGNWRTPRPGALTAIQRAIAERERLTPDEVAAALGQARAGYGSYQSLGTLTLSAAPATVTGYRRELDLER